MPYCAYSVAAMSSRSVIQTNGEDAIPKPSAHNHLRSVFSINPCIILWEKSLIGCKNSTYQRQTYLPSMRMS